MPYPPITQFETRAREAEALASLAHERRAATTSDRRRLPRWLPLRARPVQLTLRDCER